MNINRSNYEIYFLDYLDGNLPDNQVDDFLDFLANNPDLHEELKAVSSIQLPLDERVFPNKKALLKKELTNTCSFDFWAVAFMEDDLADEDKLAFLTELTSGQEKEQQFDLFLKTRLKADTAIHFSNKKALYKKSAGKVFLLWGSRIAASLVLFFAVWAVWNFEFKSEFPIQYADQKPLPTRPVGEVQPASLPSKAIDEQLAEVEAREATASKPIQVIQARIPRQEPLATHTLLVKREVVPQKLAPILSPLENTESTDLFALDAMSKQADHSGRDYLRVDEFLAQKVLNKSKDESLKFSDLINAGLNAVSSVSNERLDYETNAKGKLSEITVNTRLLAFSIPLKKER
ncbi:hypothetical protein [Sunxiuqinia sp. sy24]|uniref:hypothetical protein n=1 Tax=Sunxiuqinia sp. sy24 TaxID=3461495 RepID=UPI004045638B